MTIKTLIAAAAVAIGTLGMTNQADAQWRRYGNVYSYPTYSYSYPSYSPGVVYSSYSYPTYATSGVVVAGGYNTPYTSSYYVDPYSTGYYNNSYYSGYSNVYGNPYGVGVGTRGGMFYGRRAWRW